jgi:hypothetical protein
MDHPTALLVATTGLVVATGVLAWFTWGLWRETRAARQPRVVAYIDFVTHNYGELRFVNAGAGAALTLDITYGGEGGEQRRLSEPVMVAGDGLSYKLLSVLEREASDGESLDNVLKVFPAVVVSGTYEDVRGHTYEVNQRIDIGALHEEAKRGRRLRAFRGPLLPFYQLVSDIRDELKKIAYR